MQEKFKLGPLQRRWIRTLKQHPERQITGQLGKKNPDGTVGYCCLGQAGIIIGSCEFKGSVLTEISSGAGGTLHNSFEELGLRSSHGKILRQGITLINLNDDGHHTWVDIAYLIEAYPELFFTKSV